MFLDGQTQSSVVVIYSPRPWHSLFTLNLHFSQAIPSYGVEIGVLQGQFPISSLHAASLDPSVLTSIFAYSSVPVGHNDWELSQAHLVYSYKYSFPFPSNGVTASMPTLLPLLF